jgi:uncharacterized protein YdeI (YjbR/CyaY-like superfamily)
MNPVFFKDQNEFREWLRKNHDKEAELVVGYYKVSTGKPSMTWSESVDQAICYGWIDGIRRSIDDESYSIRFTPRRPTSIWSKINLKKVEELTKKGLMEKQGLEVFNNRKSKSGVYSFEKEITKLDEKYEKILRENMAAWEFFSRQAPSYKKNVCNWIMSARQEETKISRLNKLIRSSENHQKIY